MTIDFTRTGSPSEERFREELDGHELRFVGSVEEVGEEAEMLVILFWARIDVGFLAAHPKLRFIATRSSGYDHIDIAACRARGIIVSNVPSYGETVAEHTFAHPCSVPAAPRSRHREVGTAKRVGKFSFEEMQGFNLHGKTIGVIGTGRIGCTSCGSHAPSA